MSRRRKAYSALRPPIPVAGRAVIVVDDGLATGATMRAALTTVRAQQPGELACAVPVASIQAAADVGPLADVFVALETPAEFQAVGQFYTHFPQVSDREVAAILLS
ncbi:MAG: hypothetical protein ING75_01735 [Rhodocyclaceae bacterium]|nr:hypothetical protein [Rhodocyclaceae bacterium]